MRTPKRAKIQTEYQERPNGKWLPFLLVQILSSISFIYWMEEVFSDLKYCCHRYAENEETTVRSKSATVIAYKTWEMLGLVWDLFSWMIGLWMWGLGGYFCPSSLSPANNPSDLCWAKSRAEISNIFLKRIKATLCGSKIIHFRLLFHSKIFPLHQ